MLVISQNLVLSDEDDDIPEGTPLILWRNVVTIANVTADSEDADYPATNLANPATNQEWRGASDSPTPTTVAATPTRTSTPAACVGDCNGDRNVSVDELVRGINIALARDSLAECEPADANANDVVTIDEIVRAVSNAIDGCP